MVNKYGFRSEKEKRFPSIVHMETNNICNLKCIHCPHRNITVLIPDYVPQSMSWDVFKKVVDEVAEAGSVLRFTNDGEPTLHKDFLRQIKYIQERGVKTFAFNTNGLCLEGEKLDAVLMPSDTNIAIEVSLDAFFKKTYDQIRIGSDYQKVMANIYTFLRERDKKGLKNKKIMVSIIDQPEVAEEINLFEKFWSQIVDKIIKRTYVDTKGILESKSKSGSMVPKDRWPCVLPFTRIMIGYDGRVRFCPDDWKKESIIGDIQKSTISEIWYSEKYKALRAAHLAVIQNKKALDTIVPCNYCKEWQAIRWDYDYMVALRSLFGVKDD